MGCATALFLCWPHVAHVMCYCPLSILASCRPWDVLLPSFSVGLMSPMGCATTLFLCWPHVAHGMSAALFLCWPHVAHVMCYCPLSMLASCCPWDVLLPSFSAGLMSPMGCLLPSFSAGHMSPM
ncbi:hypothetical protein ACOMHN_065119 [Nucella lapillus]